MTKYKLTMKESEAVRIVPIQPTVYLEVGELPDIEDIQFNERKISQLPHMALALIAQNCISIEPQTLAEEVVFSMEFLMGHMTMHSWAQVQNVTNQIMKHSRLATVEVCIHLFVIGTYVTIKLHQKQPIRKLFSEVPAI